MGMIGRWIDSLTDEQRDRIIEHPDPTYDGGDWWSNARDCGCLVGAVVGKEGMTQGFLGLIPRVFIVGRDSFGPVCDLQHPYALAGQRFPQLTRRFSAPRMWRVAKTRAARANRIELPTRAASLSHT